MRKIMLILLILVLLVGCKEKELSSGPSEYKQYMRFIQLTYREQRLANTVTNSDSLIMEYNVEKIEKIYLVVEKGVRPASKNLLTITSWSDPYPL